MYLLLKLQKEMLPKNEKKKTQTHSHSNNNIEGEKVAKHSHRAALKMGQEKVRLIHWSMLWRNFHSICVLMVSVLEFHVVLCALFLCWLPFISFLPMHFIQVEIFRSEFSLSPVKCTKFNANNTKTLKIDSMIPIFSQSLSLSLFFSVPLFPLC